MTELEKEAVALFKRIWMEKGLDELSSSILGILFIEPDEISMEYLIEKTGYSAASISAKVKMLSGFGIISKRTKPGAKKIYLYMEKDLLNLLREGMQKMKDKLAVYETEVALLAKEYREKASSEREKKQMKSIAMIGDYISKIKPAFDDFRKKLEAIK